MAQRLVLACHPGGVSGDDPELLSRWQALAGPGPLARDAWADLTGRWSEPHRSYHGLAHLAAVLAVLDVYAGPVADLDPVRLAAWYHDAVYDPTRADNEERSADLAVAALQGLGVEPARVVEVRRLVLVTRTHLYAAADTDAALLCDADLAVLGAPAAAYVGYANAIRAEYAHVPDDAFRAGRTAVLRALLDRERLFGTPAMSHLEEPARRNLQAELVLLGS